MLDGLTPDQFAEWRAFRRLEPDPMERIIQILKLGFATLAGGGIDPEQFDLKPSRAPEPAASPTQAAMAFSMFAGRAR